MAGSLVVFPTPALPHHRPHLSSATPFYASRSLGTGYAISPTLFRGWCLTSFDSIIPRHRPLFVLTVHQRWFPSQFCLKTRRLQLPELHHFPNTGLTSSSCWHCLHRQPAVSRYPSAVSSHLANIRHDAAPKPLPRVFTRDPVSLLLLPSLCWRPSWRTNSGCTQSISCSFIPCVEPWLRWER